MWASLSHLSYLFKISDKRKDDSFCIDSAVEFLCWPEKKAASVNVAYAWDSAIPRSTQGRKETLDNHRG